MYFLLDYSVFYENAMGIQCGYEASLLECFSGRGVNAFSGCWLNIYVVRLCSCNLSPLSRKESCELSRRRISRTLNRSVVDQRLRKLENIKNL